MMNAELVARRQRRILIPSVYRMEYVGSLKRLTNHKDPDGYIRVMDYAQQFSQRIDFAELTEARRQLESGNAFKDPCRRRQAHDARKASGSDCRESLRPNPIMAATRICSSIGSPCSEVAALADLDKSGVADAVDGAGFVQELCSVGEPPLFFP